MNDPRAVSVGLQGGVMRPSDWTLRPAACRSRAPRRAASSGLRPDGGSHLPVWTAAAGGYRVRRFSAQAWQAVVAAYAQGLK